MPLNKHVLVLVLLWSYSCSTSSKRTVEDEPSNIDASVDIDANNVPSKTDERSAVDAGDESVSENIEFEGGDSNGQANGWRPPLTDETASVWSQEVGWKNSKRPFATGLKSVYTGYIEASSVWSDTRGVYALVSSSENETEFSYYTGLYFNDGTGWAEIYSVDLGGFIRLSGISNGPQILYGDGFSCGIEFVQDGERMCQVGFARVDGVFVVDQNLIYAVYDRYVIRYSDGKWNQIAELRPAVPEENGYDPIFPRAIWGDEQVVVVVGHNGVVFVVDPRTGAVQQQLDAPNENYWTVWGFTERDIWAGSISDMFKSPGTLVQFDGEQWKTIWTDDEWCGGIRGMWGDAGILYFHTRNKFGYWDGERINIVAHVPCQERVKFTGLWGNSVSEVFLSILNGNPDNPINGEILMSWYDGAQLRLF